MHTPIDTTGESVYYNPDSMRKHREMDERLAKEDRRRARWAKFKALKDTKRVNDTKKNRQRNKAAAKARKTNRR